MQLVYRALYLLDLQHVALYLFVSPLNDPKVFTYLHTIILIISLSFISKKKKKKLFQIQGF